MEKHQRNLFVGLREGDLAKCKRAYEGGANINWPFDRWIVHGREHWGLRVQVKPLGVYMGFSARESWAAPPGVSVDRGDTALMVALKIRRDDLASWLLSCDRLNPACRNEVGNTASDIARNTGQSFLMRLGRDVHPTAPLGGENHPPVGLGAEWDQTRVGPGPGGIATVVIAEPVGGERGGYVPPVCPEAQPVGYIEVGRPAEAVVVDDPSRGNWTTLQPPGPDANQPYQSQPYPPRRNPIGRSGHNPYDPSDGGGRARLHMVGRAGPGGGTIGALGGTGVI